MSSSRPAPRHRAPKPVSKGRAPIALGGIAAAVAAASSVASVAFAAPSVPTPANNAAPVIRLEPSTQEVSRSGLDRPALAEALAVASPLPTPTPTPSPTPKPAPARALPVNVGDPRALAQSLMASYGLSVAEFPCLDQIWTQESHWNVHAANASGAYGIPQALPGSKMASAGPDWQDNAETQIRWGLTYIHNRYGTACAAAAYKTAHGYY